MQDILKAAEDKIFTLQVGVDLVKEHRAFFENLKARLSVESNGIVLWCTDDAKEVAQSLATAFGCTFTRKRVTDNCYDWVSEVNAIPITLSMVEYTNSDLTGTLAPV